MYCKESASIKRNEGIYGSTDFGSSAWRRFDASSRFLLRLPSGILLFCFATFFFCTGKFLVGSNLGRLKEAKMGEGSSVAVCLTGACLALRGLKGVGVGGMPGED